MLVGLDAALAGDDGNLGGAATAAGSNANAVRQLAEFLSGAGEDVVILYGERLLAGPRGAAAARALLNLATPPRPRRPRRRRACSRSRPRRTAAACARPASRAATGRATRRSRASRSAPRASPRRSPRGELTTLYLLHADPLRDHPDRAQWEHALASAQVVIAHETTLTDTLREHATVVFPAEAYAEKEGTLVHPDGRVQRLRPAIGRPRAARSAPACAPAGRSIAEVARRAGHDLGIARRARWRPQRLFAAVPFYAGLTLDAIGGRGVRWPATRGRRRPAGRRLGARRARRPAAGARPSRSGALRLGTWRSLWASKEVDLSPALRFLRPRQVVELSPVDADRLGIRDGDQVEVGSNGTRVRGTVSLRASVPGGSVFLVEGTHERARPTR